MPDIAEQLDRAIGAAPSDVPALESTLVLGRRALLRRRVAYGVGAAATALVIGGTAWAVSPGDSSPSRSDDPEFVGEPSTSPTNQPQPPSDGDGTDRAADGGLVWAGADAARLDRAGGLEVRPGWRVVEDLSGPGVVAVAVAKGDRRQWFLFGDRMTIASLNAPERGYASFQEWFDVNAPYLDDEGGGGDDVTSWPGVPRDDLVRFGDGEELVALAGATVVQQQPSPEVGDSFAREGDTSAVAVVEVDGRRWYVLARDLAGPAEYIAVAASKGGPDLAAFLELVRERYAEGGGGLL